MSQLVQFVCFTNFLNDKTPLDTSQPLTEQFFCFFCYTTIRLLTTNEQLCTNPLLLKKSRSRPPTTSSGYSETDRQKILFSFDRASLATVILFSKD